MQRKPNRFRINSPDMTDEHFQFQFFSQGERKSLSPINVQLDALWNEDLTRIILLELFQDTLDYSELFGKFRMKARYVQQTRLSSIAQRTGESIDDLAQREAFTKYCEQNAKEFFTRSLAKLIANNLITIVGQQLGTKDRYYSLTPHSGLKMVIDKLSSQFLSHYTFFNQLANYGRTDTVLFLMKWVEENITNHPKKPNQSIDQLIILFGQRKTDPETGETNLVFNRLTFNQILAAYYNYLISIEHEKPENIDKKLLETEVYEKLKLLFGTNENTKLISVDDKGIFEPTENGGHYISTIYGEFYKNIGSMTQYYVINFANGMVELTKSGKLVADKIIIDTRKNTDRLELSPKPLNDIDFHEVDIPMPIEEAVKQSKIDQQKRDENVIYIRLSQLHSTKYQLISELFNIRTIISWLIITAMIFIAGIYLLATQDQYAVTVLVSGIVSFVLIGIVWHYRTKWEEPVLMSPQKDIRQKIIQGKDLNPFVITIIKHAPKILMFIAVIILLVVISTAII